MSDKHYIGQVGEYAVIFNEYAEILLLLHNGGGDVNHECYGKWHFPGGRIDRDDLPGEGLLREIAEETGLSGVELILPCHTSSWGFSKPIKYCVTYLATAKGRAEAILPPDEHHMAARWVPWREAMALPLLTENHIEIIAAVASWAKKLGVNA